MRRENEKHGEKKFQIIWKTKELWMQQCSSILNDSDLYQPMADSYGHKMNEKSEKEKKK